MGSIERLRREIHKTIMGSARAGRDIRPLAAEILAVAQRESAK